MTKSPFTPKEIQILESGLDHVFDITSLEFEEIFGGTKEQYAYISEKLAKLKKQSKKKVICCEALKEAVKDYWIRLHENEFKVYNGEYDDYFNHVMNFCPFCGNEF